MKKQLPIFFSIALTCMSTCYSMDALKEKLANVYSLKAEDDAKFEEMSEEFKELYKHHLWDCMISLDMTTNSLQHYAQTNRFLVNKYMQELARVSKRLENIEGHCLFLYTELQQLRKMNTSQEIAHNNNLQPTMAATAMNKNNDKAKKKKKSSKKVASPRKAHDPSPRTKAGEK